jgi:hypothetical protein
MITWLETLIPETTSSYSSSASGRTTGIFFPNNIGSTASNYYTSTENWSQTEINTSRVATGVIVGGSSYTQSAAGKSLTVIGTTNSTETSGTDVFVTRLSLLQTTTTISSREYTFGLVEQTTTESTIHSTTQNNGATITTAVDFVYQVPTTVSASTASSEITGTTTFGGILNTPIHATIVRAEPNEIIWHANTSSATAITNIRIASSHATTATEITLLPPTQTVVAQKASAEQQYTFNGASGTIAYHALLYPEAENQTTTAVVVYDELPNITEVIEWGGEPTIASSSLEWVAHASEEYPLFGNPEVRSFIAQRPTTFTAYTNAFSYSDTILTTEIFTSMVRVPVALSATGYGTLGGASTDQIAVTDSFREEREITAFSANISAGFFPHMGVTTSLNAFSNGIKRSIEQINGVNAGTTVAPGYSVNQPLGYIEGLTASHQRNVATLIPQQTVNADGQYFLTISGLSLTYQATSASQTASTIVQTFGAVFRKGETVDNSDIVANNLRHGETLYATTLPGIYAEGNVTQSRGLQASTYTSGSPSKAYTELSAIVPHTSWNDANYLWWVVPRNTERFTLNNYVVTDFKNSEAYEQL